MRYWLEYHVCRLGAALLNLFPLSFSYRLSRFAGLVAYYGSAKRRQITLDNLDLAFGDTMPPSEKIRIAKRAFQSMILSVTELFLVYRVSCRIPARFRFKGMEHLEKAFEKGRGAILALAHMGSWEYMSFLADYTYHPWVVIVKNLKNPYLNRKIEELRQVMHVTPVPKTDSMKKILKQLKRNGGVAVLIDQWDGPNGLWVDFFSRPTSTTSIPARLHQRLGCPVLPGVCLRTEDGSYEVQVSAPVEASGEGEELLQNLTEKLNKSLEEKIREYPDQWLWTHRRWKPRPKKTN